ncbi:MAG TPA: CAP domain-containing protein [Candidatus Saccharimonadales bacterium]|nr:CAP domain-containing protein [Candidatus Saccharimonadales bacterium]
MRRPGQVDSPPGSLKRPGVTGMRPGATKNAWRPVFLPTIIFAAVFLANISPACAQEMSIAERVLFHSVNRARVAENLPPLTWDPALAAAARQHAALMAKRQTLAHELPGEEKLAVRAIRAGAHFGAVAENIARSASAEDAHQSWMSSAGHRANILNPQLTAMGTGVVIAGENVFAVEDFSQAVADLSLGEQEARVLKLLADNGISGGKPSEDARSICQKRNALNAPRPRYEAEFETGDLAKLPEELANALKTGRYSHAAVGACETKTETPFTRFRIAVLLF